MLREHTVVPIDLPANTVLKESTYSLLYDFPLPRIIKRQTFQDSGVPHVQRRIHRATELDILKCIPEAIAITQKTFVTQTHGGPRPLGNYATRINHSVGMSSSCTAVGHAASLWACQC